MTNDAKDRLNALKARAFDDVLADMRAARAEADKFATEVYSVARLKMDELSWAANQAQDEVHTYVNLHVIGFGDHE